MLAQSHEQPSTSVDIDPVSASKRKLSIDSSQFIDVCAEVLPVSYIWSVIAIFNLLEMVICRSCNRGVITIGNYDNEGLAVFAEVRCSVCGILKKIDLNGKRVQSNSHPMNVMAVRGAMSCGGGFRCLKDILSHLNLKCMVSNTYIKISKMIAKNSIEVCIESII